MNVINVAESMLEWEPAILRKGRVTRFCRDVPGEFWELWKEHKDELKEAGFKAFQDEDDGPFCVAHVGTCNLTSGHKNARPAPVQKAVPAPPAVRRWLDAPPGHRQAMGWNYLYPDQVNAVYTLTQAHRDGQRFTMDASDAGLGKTWTALEFAKQLGIPFGVVCPANVVTKWDELARQQFKLRPMFVSSYDKVRSGRTPWLTRRVEVVRKRERVYFTWNVSVEALIIVDEVHYCAGQKSLNSKVLASVIEDPDMLGHVISATAAKSPLDLQVIGYGLGLHNYVNWWKWCLRNGARRGHFGGLEFNVGSDKRTPTKNQLKARRALQLMHANIFPKKGVRLEITDTSDRPKNQIMIDLVDVDADDKRVVEMLNTLDAREREDEDAAAEKETPVNSLTLNTRDRQRAEVLRLPYMLERIKQLRAEDNSVIAFLNFHDSIVWLFDQLDEYVSVIGGGRKNEAERQFFQANKSRICLAQIGAGSASIDLDDTRGDFPRCVLHSPTYDSRQIIQAVGRAYRMKTTKSLVRQWILFALHTVEERVGRLAQAKLHGHALFNEGSVDEALEIINIR